MLQEMFGNIIEFLNNINKISIETIGLWVSIGSLIITVIAIIVVYGIYKKQQRISNIEKMISVLSSFDLLYYSLEKHFKTWKETKNVTLDRDAHNFWKIIDLTYTVTKMQDLKTLSKIYLKKIINIEISSLLEFLGDIILISFRGEDLSDKQYENENIISSDEFSIIIDGLINKLSRRIGIKISKTPEEEVTKSFIKEHYLK